MKRRTFMLGLASLDIGIASAQGGPRRVGALVVEPTQLTILTETLRAKGWQNLQIDHRITGGDTNLSRTYARELIAAQPDVLFAVSNTSMAALHAERPRPPIIFAMVSNVVEMGYAKSFARPEGNATGFTPFEPTLGGKWVSLLKEAVPGIERIGLVYNPEPGNNSSAFRSSIDQVASRVGIASISSPSGDSSDIKRHILASKADPGTGLIFLPDAITFARRVELTALVMECRLPAIYPFRQFCEVGGLMSYGVRIEKVIASAAAYVDLILRGAKPSDLPVQAATEFELLLNQKSALELGLKLPPGLLDRADAIIS